LGKEAFCRYFKKATGNTFVGFLNQYKISQAKRLLLAGKNVGETCYECGFESLSYFNRTFKKVTNENPSEFKKKLASNLI
jgi:AraC-like DNA-binding protein